MKMPPLCLDHISLRELTALELVSAAGALGFAGVSLFVRPLPLGPYADLVMDPQARAAVRAALRDAGLAVGIVEPFMLHPGSNWDILARTVDLAAEFGADVNALAMDGDPARLQDSMVRLAGLTASAGTRMAIEGYSQSFIHTPAQAMAMARLCGDHVGITLDTLHLHRNGGTWTDLSALPAERVFHIQLADGTAALAGDPVDEAIAGRLPPGQGELGLGEFFRDHFPRFHQAGARLAVEAPFRAPEGMSALERGRVLRESVEALVAAA